MANVIKHKHISAYADDPDSSLTRPSDWNNEHGVNGGNHGAVLVRDTGQSDGANWVQSVALGAVLASAGVAATPTFTTIPLLSRVKFGDAEYWFEASGTSPSEVFTLKAERGGVTRIILQVTF